MTAPVVGTEAPETAAPESSLASEFSQILGDYGSSSSEPEPTTPSDGSTPAAAEPDAATAPEPVPDAGAAGSEPVPSEGTPPDAAAAPDVDPFAETTAASYMLNGQPVAVEDIRVFKEGGAVIRPEALPNILSRLASRDTLEAKERTASQQLQTFTKATEWTDNATGKTYSGPEAAVELRVGNANLFAENTLLMGLVSAEDLQPYLTTKLVMVDGQQKEVVVVRPEALDALRRENALQQREATATIRDHYKTALQVAPQPRSIDFTAEAPRLIQALATEAKLDPSVLTVLDREVLAELLPSQVQNGLASVQWQNRAKAMMTQRASEKAQTRTVVDATAKAAKDGQARMLAAARGVKPNVARPTSPPKPVSPQTERMDSEGALFDSILSSGASAMRSSH